MMLPPTQQASATLVTSLVQSIVDDIEKRRIEEEEKLKGKKEEDKVLKTRVKSDEVSQAANARINEHFFGALKRDENPMATLIARFTGAMGLTQGTGETDGDFATRLEDALVLTEMISKDAILAEPPEKVTLARFKVSAGEIADIKNGTAEQPSAMAQMLARFAEQNGLEQGENETDGEFSERMGLSMIALRKQLPESVAALEKSSGIAELGISVRDMIAAIRHPYGQQAEAIEAILDDKASEEKFLTADVSKILQRLEDVANPKTIEELKAERLENDPTKVEDAETRREREETIRALEAGEKLDDVEDLREVIRKSNEASVKGENDVDTGAGDGAPSADALAVRTIQVLAAGVEIAEEQASIESGHANQVSAAEDGTGDAEKARQAPSDEDQAVMLARAGQASEEQRDEEAQRDILAVTVDENGIYELLAKKNAA